MSFVQRTALHCDQCGHEWIATKNNGLFTKSGIPVSLPTHCAKCKSRQWNAGEKKIATSPPDVRYYGYM